MEKYCLKWNDFESNIRETFRDLREEQNHFDVTLACDDGHTIQAHKIILSAGSNLFRSILKQTNHPSPFIYLKGIDRIELEHVIDFLYNGEAYIAQNELDKFLETGKELKVKGLHGTAKDEIKQSKEVKLENEPYIPEKEISYYTKEGCIEELSDTEDGSVQALNTNLEVDLQSEEDAFTCIECDYQTKDKRNFAKHVKKHKGIRYPCDQCEYKATQTSNLSTHKKKCHS